MPDALSRPVPPLDCVLRFAGRPEQQHANHGQFWPADDAIDLGTRFFWQAWFKPLVSGYLVSDGHAGTHSLLWGCTGIPGPMSGNVWDGIHGKSFGGTYPIARGEWVHAAVSWDSSYLRSHINGIVDGQVPFTGPRVTTGSQGYLFVGGSDHLNGGFDLAYLQAWDRAQNPFGATYPWVAFVPLRIYNAEGNMQPCDFCCDYTLPTNVLRDLSPLGAESSLGRGPQHHHGHLFNSKNWVAAEEDAVFGYPTASPVPRWVRDSSCPFGQPVGSPLPLESIPAPSSVPGGARAFDSFGRRNQTYAFQTHPGIGSTEAGSLGPLAWLQGLTEGQTPPAWAPQSWGILGGAAVFLGGSPGAAWVPAGTADQDVRVSRDNSVNASGETGVAFRVGDKDNFWHAYWEFDPFGANGKIRVGYWQAGVYTAVDVVVPPISSWTQLRVVASGTTITVYLDALQVAQYTSSVLQSATGAGLASNQPVGSQNSLARYRKFAVLPG